MGPEVIAAIVAPTLTGLISVSMWMNKKNTEYIKDGFDKLTNNVQLIDEKIDDLRVNVAKNYVTNDQLTNHINSEEEWHIRFGHEMQQTRDEVTATRVIVDRMWMDFQNKGNM